MTRGIRVLLIACACLACFADAIQDGVTAFNEGRYSHALKQLQSAPHRDERARLYLALTQAAMNQCDQALPSLTDELKSENPNWAKLAGIAQVRCNSASGKTGDALATAEYLKTRFPSDADVLYLAAETEMKAFNDTTFQMFQRTPSSYRVHELSARIFETQNRFADAVGEYKKAIDANPAAPDLHFRLGRATLLESHSADALNSAETAFRQELKISPEDSACEFQLGQIAQVEGKTSDARQHFERALANSPRFLNALVALANSYSHEGDQTKAIPLLQRAITIQPDNEAAHYALLKSYRDAGQMDKAREEKAILDRLHKPPEGEFSEFLKKLGDGQPQQ